LTQIKSKQTVTQKLVQRLVWPVSALQQCYKESQKEAQQPQPNDVLELFKQVVRDSLMGVGQFTHKNIRFVTDRFNALKYRKIQELSEKASLFEKEMNDFFEDKTISIDAGKAAMAMCMGNSPKSSDLKETIFETLRSLVDEVEWKVDDPLAQVIPFFKAKPIKILQTFLNKKLKQGEVLFEQVQNLLEDKSKAAVAVEAINECYKKETENMIANGKERSDLTTREAIFDLFKRCIEDSTKPGSVFKIDTVIRAFSKFPYEMLEKKLVPKFITE